MGVGIFYKKFSNAAIKARTILHSDKACVCRAQPSMPMRFEARVHHLSDHALVDAQVRMTMARWHSGQDGVSRVSLEFSGELIAATIPAPITHVPRPVRSRRGPGAS